MRIECHHGWPTQKMYCIIIQALQAQNTNLATKSLLSMLLQLLLLLHLHQSECLSLWLQCYLRWKSQSLRCWPSIWFHDKTWGQCLRSSNQATSKTVWYEAKSSSCILTISCWLMHWIGICVGTKSITNFTNATGVTIDLITLYGQITMAEIQAQCKQFILPGGVDINTRVAQNNNMMAIFLMASLTEEATARLTPYQNEYTINGKVVAPLIYKVIMRQAMIDSKATSKNLWANINELPSFVPTVSATLIKLTNALMRIIANWLHTVKLSMIRLPNCLMHTSMSDAHISRHISQVSMKSISMTNWQTLLMRNWWQWQCKFNYPKQKGRWGSKTEEEMIIAIVAEFEKLKGEFQLSNQLKQAAATPNSSDGKGNNMSK